MKIGWSGSTFLKTISGTVDRLLLKTMSALSLKAQISGGKAVRQLPEQRVGDNALHLGLGNALETTRSTLQHRCIPMWNCRCDLPRVPRTIASQGAALG